jgi:hypothetical protein
MLSIPAFVVSWKFGIAWLAFAALVFITAEELLLRESMWLRRGNQHFLLQREQRGVLWILLGWNLIAPISRASS